MNTASGQLQTWAADILQLHASEVATLCNAHKLPETDQAVIMHDLGSANAMILLQLRVKLAFWEQLPYVCFALAHCDPNVARTTMTKAKKDVLETREEATPAEHAYLPQMQR